MLITKQTPDAKIVNPKTQSEVEGGSLSKLEELAFAQATGLILSGLDGQNDCLKAYLHLSASLKKDEEPEGLIAYWPYENMSWADIADNIDTEAESILSYYKQVLKLAKEGIVHSAIEATLDSDMNLLDMTHMVEQGAKQERTMKLNKRDAIQDEKNRIVSDIRWCKRQHHLLNGHPYGDEVEQGGIHLELYVPAGTADQDCETALKQGYAMRNVVRHSVIECPLEWFKSEAA